MACAVADHHCSGNIVQALSKCASAIQGGESLDSQQEKCAPDGCNYDCPSVDLINDLQVDLSEANTRIDTLQQYAKSLAANSSDANMKIASLQTSQDLTGAIADSNVEQIDSLKGQVSDIQSDIDDANLKIASTENIANNNTGKISSLKQQINNIPTSCQDVKTRWPDSPSGIYLMTLPNGNMSYVYCHLGNLCGSSDGWMRIAYLDMTDPAQECPSELRTLNEKGVKCCGRKENVASCDGLFFSSKGTSYSEICGRVTGYQWGSPDYIGTGGNIDSHYVEGISITYGSPRQHLWTFIATIRENVNHCPCSSGNSGATPSFVGQDYFCESGNSGNGWSQTLYSTDKLWDGFNCGSQEAECCNADGLPWFYRQLSSPTSDDIELRVCGDQGINDEDNPVESYEIYIK